MYQRPTRDAAIAQMSHRLLQGWTMLADVCPMANCDMPLLRNRKNQDVFCVGCNLPVKIITAPEPQTVSGSEDQIGRFQDKQQQQDHHHADLMGHNQVDINQRKIDKENEKEIEEEKEKEKEKEMEMEENKYKDKDKDLFDWDRLLPNSTQAISTSGQTATTKQEKSITDIVSERIGQKLLLGWCLLQKSCPKCETPLMRSRNKVELCVYCGEESNHQQQQPQSDPMDNNTAPSQPQILASRRQKQQQQPPLPLLQQQLQPPSKRPLVTSVSDDCHFDDHLQYNGSKQMHTIDQIDMDLQVQMDHDKQQREKQRLVKQPRAISPSLSQTDPSTAALLAHTQQILLDKVAYMNSILTTQSNMEVIQKICITIKELMHTLVAVQEARKVSL